MLPLPPPGADAAEGAAAAEHVERRDRLRHQSRRTVRDRRDEGAQRQVVRPTRQQPEGHVGLRQGVPGAPDLGDLDQVVHHASPVNPTSSATSATPVSQPAGSSPHGNCETCSTTSSPVSGRVGPEAVTVARRWSARAGRHRDDQVPALGSRRRPGPSASASAGPSAPSPGRDGRAPRCAPGTVRPVRPPPPPRPADRRARATSTQARRRAASSPRVSTTVVRRRPARAATMRSRRSNASADASRSAGPAADDGAQRVGRDDLDRPGTAARPSGSCRTRRRRPGRRGQDQAVARRSRARPAAPASRHRHFVPSPHVTRTRRSISVSHASPRGSTETGRVADLRSGPGGTDTYSRPGRS